MNKVYLEQYQKVEFQKAYTNLTVSEQIPVRDELMEELGWSLATFYNRKTKRHHFRKLEIEPMAKIFARHGVDIFTGERIK